MVPNFQKIYNVKFNLNADYIISKIEKTIVSQNLSGAIILKDESGIPFWQKYESGICFARNFYTAFPTECNIVARTLTSIKDELYNTDNPSEFLLLFLNSTILSWKVNLMKVPSGLNVSPHTDVNRSTCINIGLKNSNTAITYVSNYTEENFWSNPTEEYQMEDGDVYLLNNKKTHAIKSIVSKDSNLDRYIITCTLY
jgi:hypothetical protein